MTDPLCFRSVPELALEMRRDTVSAVDVVEAHLERIEDRDERTNAFVEVFERDALAAAREADRARREGEELGPLHGLPVAVKDNYAVGGKRFTNGCVPLSENVAEEDDLTVRQLREAGAVVIGKTNTPEFATKGVTDNDLFGATGTPFDRTRMAGGSSGGSAAAAGDGMAPIGLGTDGGGSLRIPASACGVFGMKPSFGRVPIPLRPDGFAHHTPMRGRGALTRTVEGAAMVLDVLSGYHPSDPFTVETGESDFVAATRRPISDMTIAYSVDLGGTFPVDERVRRRFHEAVDAFKSGPAEFVEVDPELPRSRTEMYRCWKTGFSVVLAEALEHMKQDGTDLLGEHREALDAQNVADAEAAMELGAVEYRRTDVVRTEVFEAFQSLFAEYDLLLLPTIAVPPFEHGKWGPEEVEGESVDPVLEWALTWLFNLTGHPAASVPAGVTRGGLPVGMQIVGPRFADQRVLAASGAFERIKPWHDTYDELR
ncbi:amidase [Halomicroarcula sp. GCM10025324]|uniref:amidase n=1 Tax=Haloarcula TaxID=2237 RepID=UPI0023E81911|nr:amidase [Halomicroarcula sp. ZS-22-S1]